MQEAHVALRPKTHWYDGLTSTHWRVLRGGMLGWIFDGFEAIALIVVLAPMLKSVLTPQQALSTPVYAGTVIGITLLAWGVGGMVGGILADYVGRKRMMLWSVFLYALFSGLTAFANTFAALCALRVLTGLAMGSEWSTGVALVSETWPEHARAKGAGFLSSGFGWGTLLATVVWYALASTHPLGAQTWRLMFVAGALPAFFVLYLRRGLNESEQWQKAVKEKRWNATADGTRVAAQPGQQDKRPFTLKQLLTEREALRRTLLTTLLSIIATTGWWAISSWLPTFTVTLAKAAGAADAVAWGSRISIIYTAGAVVAYLASGFIVDAIGRRPFLSMTFIGALIATIITYKYTATLSGMLIIAPINGFFTLGCAYAWMAIYPCELFTPTVRSTAISFVSNAARLIAWVFPIVSGSMIKTFDGVPQAALIMSSCYILGIVVPWFMPETRGKGMPE